VVWVDPLAGGNLQVDGDVTVDVTDNVGLGLTFVAAKFGSDGNPHEVIWDGTQFAKMYEASTRNSISGGFRYVIRRRSNWPASPTIQAIPIKFFALLNENGLKHLLKTTFRLWNKSSMYFGTSWHEYHHLNSWLPEEKQMDSWHFDVNYVTLEGQGLYVGDALTVFNTADAWWGEGDEKIFVDDDIFPRNYYRFLIDLCSDHWQYVLWKTERFAHGRRSTEKWTKIPRYRLNIPFINNFEKAIDLLHKNRRFRIAVHRWGSSYNREEMLDEG